MGNVVHPDFGCGIEESPVSKKRLAAMLDCSTRWLELRVREGLPSSMVRGRRLFIPREVWAWIMEHAPNSSIAKQLAVAQEPPAEPTPKAPKRRGPVNGPARPDAPVPTNTPTPAEQDRSRAESIAAIEKAIRTLQQQLTALKGDTTPAA